jgi:EAL and modified HD-GYP domain-containing signal transduction protein
MQDHFIVGRQPIFDQKLDVVAYKLVVAALESIGGGRRLMTDGASLAGGVGIDLGHYFDNSPVYVPLSPAAITGAGSAEWASERTIVEVRASECNTSDAIDACRALVGSGRSLCVDAGMAYEVPDAVLELASSVKFDIGFGSRDRLRQAVRDLSDRGLAVVAKGVDSMHRVEVLADLGFEVFEGTVMSQPIARINEALTPSRLTCLQLIEAINDPKTSAKDIERLVEREPGLSYRILHVSGVGSSGGLRRTVDSISQAVVLMGRDSMYNWLILMLMSDASRGTPEQLTIAMTRARMCRLMASTVAPALVDSAYTVGLVAAMDLLLGTTLSQIIDNLAVTKEIADAVVNHTGVLGDILDDVMVWETAKFDSAELRCGVDLPTAEQHYLEALEWAVQLASHLDRPAVAA